MKGSFTQEKEMRAIVYGWLKEQGLTVESEFAVPWGICDLVGISLNNKNIARRLKNGQTKSMASISKISIFREIPDDKSGHSIRLDTLYRNYSKYLSSSDILRVINQLKRDGFIFSTRRNHYQSLNGWIPLYKRIVAVELKLNRIKDVLLQAKSNTSFATESYAAFPLEVADRISKSNRIREFIDDGVGIISVTSNQCEMILKASPKSLDADNNMRFYCAEHFWRKFIKDNET